MEKSFYHWCCEGLKNDIIFRSTVEFIAGMNRIAVCWLQCQEAGRPVYILAFCLLNNHFHFVLYGSEEDTAFFMERYKMLTAQWISRRRGEKLHGSIILGHWKAYSKEAIKEKIVYNLRQTVEAGLPYTPQGYPWCSAYLMFSDNSFVISGCRKASEYSAKKLMEMMSSPIRIPGDWLILSNGMVWPGCYTAWSQAEKAFQGTGDFMFMLNNGNVDRRVNSEIASERPAIPDLEMKHHAADMVREMYGKSSVSGCSAEERLAVARRLRKKLGCGHKQLARIVQMKEEDLRKLV